MNCEACGHENAEGARFCARCGALMPLPHHDENPMVGQLIGGRYRITGVLGEGGMGVVYVGEQQMGSTIRKVAVKTLHPHLSKDPSVLARFHRECGTVAQLEHPNTIKFYDFGSTADGTLYIAMEFVAGKPLSKIIEQEGALSSERAIKILRQICGALDEAHTQGIIHRDLKPDNVILADRAGEADFVKVLDFGIAARSESADAQKEQKLTQQGMVLGTPPYMSPEQFTGKALDRRSDIYSLGVVAYEMLTGRLPFEADTPWQWATQHMTAQPAPFELSAPSAAIPEPMRRAILRALAKNREERQESARQFYAEFSEGGQLTAERAARAGGATGTAAMGAPPDFGAGPGAGPHVPPTAGMGGSPPYGYAPQQVPGGQIAQAVPAPARASGKGPGKGLIIGLAGLGGVLLVAIVVVAMRSVKHDTDEPLTNPAASTSVATLTPQVDTTKTEPTATAPADTPDAGSGVGQPIAQQPIKQQKPQQQKPVEKKPPALTGAAACDACISAAQSGNVTTAAAHFARCDDTAKKQRCRGLALSRAPAAAQAAAFNGNCGQARAIAAAVRSMGGGDLSNSMKSCK